MAKLSNINNLFSVDSTGAIEFSTQVGDTGYVLESRGAGNAPVWTDRDTGGVRGTGTENKVVRWNVATATGVPQTIGDGPITFSAATAAANSTFGGNISGNSDNTTEVGIYSTGGIKRIRMVQGGEIHFGDTTTAAPLGITEGDWNDFGDHDRLSIYGRSSIKLYSGSNPSSGNLRLTLNTSSNFEGAINTTGNVELKSDAGGATKFLRIWNEGTVEATDDALITWQTQASRTYSMGINRESGSLTITNQDASVRSGELFTIASPTGNAKFSGNISFPNSDLSSTAPPTNFGVYNSEIRLIETPNGGLQKCRVITDNYGEWILVGRFAASAMNTIANGATWSSVSGLSLGTAQNETTQFSADFGDSYPTEVRIMGATDFTKWRDTRTVDFIYGVPEGRQWRFFFSGGATNGMTSVGPNHSGNNKFGWNINGSYDGFGRWANPLQTSVGMSDGNVTNPSAAYTAATANAFAWDGADDAKITVTATRTFSGQDSYSTSGFGNDDNVYGFFDEYPNEVINMLGGADFSSAAWILIKLPNADSGGGGDTFWRLSGTDIYNTNSGNVAIGTTDPGNVKLFVQNPNASTNPVFQTKLDTAYNLGMTSQWVSQYVSKIQIGRIGSSTSQAEFIYDIAGTEYASIKRNYGASSLKFERGGTTDMIIDGSGYVGIGNTSGAGARTKLGVTFGVTGNAANLAESVSYAAIEMYPYRNSSTYGMFMGAMGNTSGYIQSANTDGTAAGAFSINPWGGNVGIGTTLPTFQLSIENHDTTTSAATMEIDGKRTNGTDGPVGEMIFSNNGDTFATVAAYRDTADNKGALYFQTQGASGFSTKMIIRNSARIEMSADVTMSGSVGIGETSLQRKFNLYDGTDTWTRVQCGASTADWLHGIAGSDHTYKWYNQSSNGGVGYKMAIATSGTLTVSADLVAYGSPSDKRLKENIKPIKSALDKVSKLQGVTFDWKEKGITNLKEDIGFIAQDVQKVIPELVRENKDGMLSMRHQGIAPILLEAIKELKAEIEELKKCKCDCKK